MRAYVYCFSPTGTTKRIALGIGRSLDAEAGLVELADASVLGGAPIPQPEDSADTAGESPDVVVFAVPVFAGRVPQPAAEAIARIDGGGKPAASVVVYGNRDFDDALVELNDLLAAQGFSVIGSGAFVAQHSMLPSVAAGRPDSDDLADAEEFARRIAEKLAGMQADGGSRPSAPEVPGDGTGSSVPEATGDGASPSVPEVPGNRPYKEAPAAPWVPAVSDDCTLCGICADRCPAEAIPLEAPNTTGSSCFQCMRCAAVCPEGARGLPAPVAAMIAEKLAPIADVRKPNQMWL